MRNLEMIIQSVPYGCEHCTHVAALGKRQHTVMTGGYL
jgi:hypothetical protein